MPPLDLQKFKKPSPVVQPVSGTGGMAKQPLDLGQFKKGTTPEPEKGFIGRTIDYAKNELKRGADTVGKTSEKFVKSPVVDKPLVALKAPMQATGAAARVLFSPLTIALGDAMEGLSNMPSVQRIAMGDKIGKILDRAEDANVTLGDFAKNNPDMAQDVQDFVDTITLAVGPKVAKPVARAGEKAIESLPSITRRSLQAERSIGAADSAATRVLSGVSDGTDEALAAFRKYDIEPPVSAVTRSKVVQSAEAMAQTSMVGGARVTQIIDKAREGISRVVESLRKEVNAEDLKSSGVTAEAVGRDMQESLKKIKTEFDTAKNKIYDEAEKLIGDQQAKLDDTRSALEEIISQKNASLDPSAKVQANYYQELLNSTRTAEKRDFRTIKATRTDIGRKMKNPMDPVATGDRANLSRLYAALSKDLDATVSLSGKDAAAALKMADAFYKAGIDRINSFVGRTIYRSRSPEMLVGKIIKPNSVTEVRNLKNVVGEEAFHQVGALFMNNLIDSVVSPLTGRLNASKLSTIMAKYGDETLKEVLGDRGLQQLKDLRKRAIIEDIIDRGTADGKVQPRRLSNAIESYDEKVLKEAFTPEELTKLRDVEKMSGAIGKGTRIAEGSPTAEKAQIGANVLLGTISIPTLLAKMGVEWGLTKLFTTPAGRKLLSRGKITPKSEMPKPMTPQQIPKDDSGSITRYSEADATPPTTIRNVPATRYSNKNEAFGGVVGLNTDEEGNVNFNPVNAALGVAAGAAGKKMSGQKFKNFFKKNPPAGVLKDMEEFIDYARLKKLPEGYTSGVQYEADIREQIAKWGVNTEMTNGKLANQFEEYLIEAKKPPATQGRDNRGRFTNN